MKRIVKGLCYIALIPLLVVDELFYGHNGSWYRTNAYRNMANHLGLKWAYVSAIRGWQKCLPISDKVVVAADTFQILLDIFGGNIPKMLTYGKRLMSRYQVIRRINGRKMARYEEMPGHDGVIWCRKAWMEQVFGTSLPLQVTVVGRGFFAKGMLAPATDNIDPGRGLIFNQDSIKVGDASSVKQNLLIGVLSVGSLQRHTLSFQQMQQLNDLRIVLDAQNEKMERLHAAVLSGKFVKALFELEDEEGNETKEDMRAKVLLDADDRFSTHPYCVETIHKAVKSQAVKAMAPIKVDAPIVLPDDRVPKGSISLWATHKYGKSVWVSRNPCIDMQGFSLFKVITRDDDLEVVYCNPADMPTFKMDFDGDRLLLIHRTIVKKCGGKRTDIFWHADEPAMENIKYDGPRTYSGLEGFIEAHSVSYVGILTDMLTLVVEYHGEPIRLTGGGMTTLNKSEVRWELGLPELGTALQCAVDSMKKAAKDSTKCGSTTWGEVKAALRAITATLDLIKKWYEECDLPCPYTCDVFPSRRRWISSTFGNDLTMVARDHKVSHITVGDLAFNGYSWSRDILRDVPEAKALSVFVGMLGKANTPTDRTIAQITNLNKMVRGAYHKDPVWSVWRDGMTKIGKTLPIEELAYFWDMAHRSTSKTGKASYACVMLAGWIEEHGVPPMGKLSLPAISVYLDQAEWKTLPIGSNIKIFTKKGVSYYTWKGELDEIGPHKVWGRIAPGYYNIIKVARTGAKSVRLMLDI